MASTPAMATRFFCPALSIWTGRSARSLDPHGRQRSFNAPANLVLGETEVQGPERDVLIDVAGEQLVVRILKHQPDRRSPPGQRAPVPGHRAAIQPECAGVSGGAFR